MRLKSSVVVVLASAVLVGCGAEGGGCNGARTGFFLSDRDDDCGSDSGGIILTDQEFIALQWVRASCAVREDSNANLTISTTDTEDEVELSCGGITSP